MSRDSCIRWPESGALGKCPTCRHWTYDLVHSVCCKCERDRALAVLRGKDDA